MFPELPSYQADEEFLHALGVAGGPCDCGDIEDLPASLGDSAAGWPIFGQFVAHDITADRSTLRSHANLAELRNARSPQLNLEVLYGDGPTGHPFLYQRDDPAKFLLGLDGIDVQRNGEGIAIIGDPRNDSHMLMSQLHLAMLKAHNAFVDQVRQSGVAIGAAFDEAARQLRWHYQWIVLHEFLPALVGESLLGQVRREGPRWFRPGHHRFIPLEFADAAYRYGHSQIRHRYRLNSQNDPVRVFPELLGFRPVPPERKVDWTLFFEHQMRHRHSGLRRSTESWCEHYLNCRRQFPETRRLRLIIRWLCVTCSADKVLGYRLVRRCRVTSESNLLPKTRLASPSQAGMAKLRCGTTFSAKLTSALEEIDLVQWVVRSLRKY